MSFVVNDEAMEKARQTIAAARMLYSKADEIAAACEAANQYEVVIASVNRDLEYAGSKAVLLPFLSDEIKPLEETGWALVFSTRTTELQVESRCIEMAKFASKRLATLQRIVNRRLDNQS